MNNRHEILLLALAFAQGIYAQTGVSATDTLRTGRDSIDRHYVLSEVAVTADNVKRVDNHLVYIPNSRQRKFSNNSLDLLNHLDIPTIKVDRGTGAVSAGNRKVTIYIDGRKAGADEISTLRAKDIKNVEYHDVPMGKYSSDEASVNFITKKYVSGGYVQPSVTQYVGINMGRYNVSSKFFKNKTSYMLYAGYGYADTHQRKSEQEETFTLDGTNYITRTGRTVANRTKNNNGYVQFAHAYNGKVDFFTGRYTLTLNRIPKNHLRRQLSYSTGETTEAENDLTSKGTNVSAYLFWRKTFRDKSSLESTLSGSFTRNSYDNIYRELAKEYSTDANENQYYLLYETKWIKSLNKGSFTASLRGYYMNSDASYEGTYSSNRHFLSYNVDALTSFNKKLGENFYLNLDAQLRSMIFNGHAGIKKTWVNPCGYVSMQYTKKRISLSLENYALTGDVNLADLCNTIVAVDGITDKRGNADVKVPRQYFNRLAFSYNSNKYSASVEVWYNYFTNLRRMTYEPDNGRLLSWNSSDANVHQYYCLIGQTLGLGKSVKLKGSVFLGGLKAVGGLSDHKNYISADLTSMIYLGNFCVSPFIGFSTEHISFNGFVRWKSPLNYGLQASYSRNNLYVSLTANNPLRYVENRSSYSTNFYSFKNKNSIDTNSNVVNLTLTYSFDFGLKVQKENPDLNTNSTNTLL